jgi:hypothetical protein
MNAIHVQLVSPDRSLTVTGTHNITSIPRAGTSTQSWCFHISVGSIPTLREVLGSNARRRTTILTHFHCLSPSLQANTETVHEISVLRLPFISQSTFQSTQSYHLTLPILDFWRSSWILYEWIVVKRVFKVGTARFRFADKHFVIDKNSVLVHVLVYVVSNTLRSPQFSSICKSLCYFKPFDGRAFITKSVTRKQAIAYNSVLVSVGILIEFVCIPVFSISNKQHCFRSTEVQFYRRYVGRRGTFLSGPI